MLLALCATATRAGAQTRAEYGRERAAYSLRVTAWLLGGAEFPGTAPEPPPRPRADRGTGRRSAGPMPDDAFLRCTIQHESLHSGVYSAVNPNGHYGAYQFGQGTWDGVLARLAKANPDAGYGEWVGRRPDSAPPAVQDAAALQLRRERGTQPWGGRCG